MVPQASLLRRVCPVAVAAFQVYFFPTAFLLAAHRAFISCESLLRPAGVIPPFLFAVFVAVVLPFLFAHRARIAAAILARA